jgi:hypothetical protein
MLLHSFSFFRLVATTRVEEFEYQIPVYLDIWTSSGNCDLKRELITTLKDFQHYSLDYEVTTFMPVVSISGNEYYEAFKILVCTLSEIFYYTFTF